MLTDEEDRLKALGRYQILETASEQEYDDLVELASAICGTPIALLTFIDKEHQWFKASVGVPRLRTARADSFCTHAIAHPGLFTVPDTVCDSRFCDNPFVTGEPHVRFYAGMPLRTEQGQAIGTICVLDTEPRDLTPAQSRALAALSRQAMSLLELRLSVGRLEQTLAESEQTQADLRKSEMRLRESEDRLQFACRAGQIGLWGSDLRTHQITWSESQAEIFGVPSDEFDGSLDMVLSRVHAEDRARLIAARAQAIQTLSPLNIELRVQLSEGKTRWLLVKGEVSADAQGAATHITGSATDITERKQSEEALRFSEERLRSVVTGAPIILFALDADGNFTVSEGKGLERIGLLPGEVVGRSAYDLYAGSADAMAHLGRAYSGEAFSERSNIGAVTFETWYSPEFGKDGHVTSVIGVSCDITGRCQAEEALRNSEARFQAFMDNNPTFAYVKDQKGHYVYCNDAFDRLNGLQHGECIGRTALDLWPGELGEKIHADTLEALERRRLTETLTEVPDAEGSLRTLLACRFTFQDSAGELFIGCLAVDVTEQKRAEQQWKSAQQNLEAALSQLNATLESTADGLLVVDAHGHILRANKIFYEMWRQPEEMTQNRDDTKQLEAIVGQLCDPGAFLSRVQELYSHPDETSFDVLNLKDGRIFERYSRPLLIQETYAGRVWSFRDVTEQEKTRHELIRAKNHALASVQAKSEFLANMSHEIRTPMNGILGMTDLLLATSLPPPQKHHALTIKNSADSLLTVINDILDFSKIEAGKLTLESVPFSISQIMQEVKDLLEPRAVEKKIGLTCSLPLSFPPFLSGDPARLRQILTNLVGNALKFTERGKVILEASVLRETPTHAEFRLSVRDTGVGIPKDRQTAIFDSFTQADGSITRRYGGTGLGLAICLRLTDLMAGRIGVESEPGRGSEFWLTVTLEKTEAILEKPAATLWSAQAEPLGLRVLLAEDNVINQEVACGYLEMWGCRVDVAGNGWLACCAVREREYDLVLMDIQMPEMDGRQATAEIRARERGSERHLPIIAMTAHNMQGDREQCLAFGMDDYVSKPVNPEELLAALKRWGQTASSTEAPPSSELLAAVPPSSELLAAVPLAAVPADAWPRLPVLDVERLHRSCAGKAKLERRIMMETLRLTPEILGRLAAAVSAADAEACRFEAHTLKGSSRTLGAEALGNAASDLEDAAKSGATSGALELLGAINVQWANLRPLLEDCLTQEPWNTAL